MAKTYTELEAWGIFIGALTIGVVLTSVFWALITIPEEVKKIEKEIENATEANATEITSFQAPSDFIRFCKQVEGISNWDNTGLRQCTVKDASEKNLIVMNFLCKKFNLSMSYGSFGVKCEGKN